MCASGLKSRRARQREDVPTTTCLYLVAGLRQGLSVSLAEGQTARVMVRHDKQSSSVRAGIDDGFNGRRSPKLRHVTSGARRGDEIPFHFLISFCCLEAPPPPSRDLTGSTTACSASSWSDGFRVLSVRADGPQIPEEVRARTEA